ncbi:transglutaminase-like domain-containing protein [Paracoccus aminophilus]|uniref:Transglutaminase n=1 Tax=Paracoccus aminophilus JCM 7686 TaxID=1367847 RepID=S5YEP7_PARAH|nr:transglutaminase family protein [Paracoccus aminophilus]AGT09953.1 transglutaminase [Paracoccus aminophilus JCM 7686]
MLLRYGYRIVFETDGALPLVTQLAARPERRMDLRVPEIVRTFPAVHHTSYTDGFGNLCTRLTAPDGRFELTSDAIIADSGLPDPICPEAGQDPVDELPDDVLIYLLSSRYCEVDLMGPTAWELFGQTPPGWARVQAVSDWVNDHMRFSYHEANPRRTAFGAYQDRVGVCRDYTHLAITMCRALNIPARYINGYLGDIGIPPEPTPMDFAAWMQVWLGGQWWTFDPRNHALRVGRIVVSIGRDATDCALISSFGQHRLQEFKVWTDEVNEAGEKISPGPSAAIYPRPG